MDLFNCLADLRQATTANESSQSMLSDVVETDPLLPPPPAPTPAAPIRPRVPFAFDILPNDLSRYILTEWIQNTITMAKIDMACCNHTDRMAWLAAVLGITATTDHKSSEYNLQRLQWVFKRRMFLNPRFAIEADDFNELAHLWPIFAKLRFVWFSESLDPSPDPGKRPTKENVCAFFKSCPLVVHLQVQLGDHDETIHLLQAAAHLKLQRFDIHTTHDEGNNDHILISAVKQWHATLISLDCYRATDLTDITLRHIAQCCPNLQELSLLVGNANNFTTAGLRALLLVVGPSLLQLSLKDSDDTYGRKGSPVMTWMMLNDVIPHLKLLQVVAVYQSRECEIVRVLPTIIRHCKALTSVSICQNFNYYPTKRRLEFAFKFQYEFDALFASEFPHPIEELFFVCYSAAELEMNINKFGHSLRHLTLFTTAVTMNSDLMELHILAKCPHLEYINFRDIAWTHCRDSWFRLVDVYGHQLKGINICGSGLTDEHLRYCFQRCPLLEEIETDCPDMSPETFALLLPRPNLSKVKVHENLQFTAEVIARLIIASDRVHRPFKLKVDWSESLHDIPPCIALRRAFTAALASEWCSDEFC